MTCDEGVVEFGRTHVSFSLEDFNFVMDSWTTNPEKVSKSIRSVEILSEESVEMPCTCHDANVPTSLVSRLVAQSQTEAVRCDCVKAASSSLAKAIEQTTSSDVTSTKVRVVTRKILPRVPDKDPEVDETVSFFHCGDEHSHDDDGLSSSMFARVTFQPKFVEGQELTSRSLPFQYPKCIRFSFVYIKCRNSCQCKFHPNPLDKDVDSNTLPCGIVVMEGIPLPSFTQEKLVPTADKLLKKLNSWGTNNRRGYQKTFEHDVCVPKSQFYDKYDAMKKVYRVWAQKWPEKTDPQKFVYEDIAIASYLLSLWENERKEKSLDKKQSFVDLGCGNGLLCHILSQEGHPGKGLDLHRRKVWEMFEAEGTHLECVSISDPKSLKFPATDWIIGNHADEISPWVPFITHASSYNARYFSLPCCLHDFDRPFTRKAHNKSRYQTYLDFLEGVGTTCGFKVEVDALRIPSVKRIAHVARSRSFAEGDNEALNKVEEAQSQLLAKSKYKGFAPREKPDVSEAKRLEKKRKHDELRAARVAN